MRCINFWWFGAQMQSKQMKRRDILALVGGVAVAWPLDVIAQARQLPVVGVLGSGSPDAFAPFLATYRQGMSKRGYIEDRNVEIVYRWAKGNYGELDMLADELVRLKVTLIVASGGLISAKAAMKATQSIPILFVSGYDPVKLGLVASLGRPGGKATGVALFTTQLLPKQLQLLSQLGPQIRTVAVLSNPAFRHAGH